MNNDGIRGFLKKGSNGFVGFVRFAAALPGAVRLDEFLARFGVRRGDDTPCGRAVIVQGGKPSRLRDFAAACRLDNRTEIAALFGLNSKTTEDECIRACFEARGDDGIAQLLGAFAFAHWDERSRTLTLARDCLGKRTLFYHVGDGFAAFATHLSVLFALLGGRVELDEEMLARFHADDLREPERTLYRGIVRVPSRTVVRIGPSGVMKRHYWRPNLDGEQLPNDQSYIERARELFDRAVTRCLRDTPRAALLLSGGLDSTAVGATATRIGGCDITCYSVVPDRALDLPQHPNWRVDERDKIEALMRHYPALKVHLMAPRGNHVSQSEPQRRFPILPVPLRTIANFGWFEPIEDQILADGHAVLLTGGLGNYGLSWSGAGGLAALLQQGQIRRVWREASASARATGSSRLRELWNQALRPLLPAAALRLWLRLRGSPIEFSETNLLRSEILTDLLRQWRSDNYDIARGVREMSRARRAYFIFDHNQVERDLGSMRYEAGGLEYRDPHSDRDLLEFCLGAPDYLFRRNGVSRWFARQVLDDRLPSEILDEPRRGEQAPNWFESLNARKAVVEAEVERMEASPLASRLIDMPRLKRLIAEWPIDAQAADARMKEYRYALNRAVHVGQFIRWVEGGN